MSPTSFKTPDKAKKFRSPTSTLEPRISESSINSNTPRTPIKPPNPPRTPRTGSKARKRLNFGKLSVIKEIAQQANREMSPDKRAMLSQQLNGNPTPPNVTSLFAQIDAERGQLSASSKTKLKRAHSMANSVLSFTNNDESKITTMYNVQNLLEELRSELGSKQKQSVNLLRTVARLEKELERSRERHARASEIIREHMLGEENVPIIITKKPTEEINKLTKQMEKLKGVSNSERSKLLGLIVSLSKKQKGLRNALSKVKNVAVSKKSNVDKLKNELQEYKTKIQQYENLVKNLRENASTRKPVPNDKTSKPKTTTTSTQTSPPKKTPSPKNSQSQKPGVKIQLFTSTNQEATTTPNQPIQGNGPPSIKEEHRKAKNQGARKRAEERRKRREREGQPKAQRSLEPIFNRQKNTPPGITKTNLERLFQPFKQPVTVTVAPTISVKGGSAKQGIVMLASNATKKKKKTPPPKPQYLKTPGTIRREKEKARSISVRKQLVASMRTPTKGQRKTHVIQLIDRVLRKMKAPKDTEKKLIKLYESLSEKQIKSLFGGRSPEFVKNTLKKQIGYLEKKKR
jgi:hypothetical protein